MNKYYEPISETIDKTAARVVKYTHERGLSPGTAERCTGGTLSAAVTSVPETSAVFVGGAVTYSAEMKTAMIGVSSGTIKTFSVYSHETARKTAAGICPVTGADIGVGITGIAGSGGGTKEMPVGTVFVAVSLKGGVMSKELELYEKTGGTEPDRRTVGEPAVPGSPEWLPGLPGAEKEVGRECQ